jgi:hypothetical protein
MKIAIGPKGRQVMFRVMLGYSGPGRRFGVHRFGNGYELRLGSFHAMVWRPHGVMVCS